MSTSTKSPQTIRHGGPGASHENAREPPRIVKRPADEDNRKHSRISGGGGERDIHHTRDPEKKGGGSHPAGQRS